MGFICSDHLNDHISRMKPAALGLAQQSIGARIWPSALHVRANADGLRIRTPVL